MPWLVASFTDDCDAIKKSIANPDAINFKGITISPSGSFLAAETVWRQGATGGDINTHLRAYHSITPMLRN